MRRVLFVNGFIYLPGEGGYKRSLYLFDMMKKMGYDVTLLTSDFNHYSKEVRDVKKFRENFPEYSDIKFVHIPSYKKNISIKRWYCMKVYCNNAINWIKKNIDEFDVIYMNMPDAKTILGVNDFLQKKRIPLIIDIRDLFPEALRVKIKNNLIYKLLTYVMKKNADKAYSCADELIAVSQEYLDRGLKVNKKSQHPEVVYIGSVIELFDDGVKTIAPAIEKPKGEFWLTYAGTIGSSYDLKTAIMAMEILKFRAPNVRFKILGQGPDRASLEVYVKEKNLPVDFIGFVNYAKMAAYLSKSDVALNSIKYGASQSIINKVADYYAAGIPILNSCWCKEQIWLNEYFNVGVNHKPENVEDFVEKFMFLYTNDILRKEMGRNARKLAEERFNRAMSYKKIIYVIDNVIKKY